MTICAAKTKAPTLVRNKVTEEEIAEVVSKWTGIPVAKMLEGGKMIQYGAKALPEGGWNAFELRLLEEHRFAGIGMGPRTLRTDTACLALLAVLGHAQATGPETGHVQ